LRLGFEPAEGKSSDCNHFPHPGFNGLAQLFEPAFEEVIGGFE
jgi:hypothetical protein